MNAFKDGPSEDVGMDVGAPPSEDSGGVTEGPPNSPTGASASASDSEDTSAASAAAFASSADCASIVDTVCAMEGVTVFCDVLTERMLILASSTSEDADLSPSKGLPFGRPRRLSEDVDDALGLNDASKEFTLFVPTDTAFAKTATAFEQLSDEEAGRVVMFHLYEGMMLTSDKLACGEKIISMNENGDASRTKCGSDGNKKYQNGNGNTKTGTLPEIASADTMACNGVIHTLDAVMFPVSLSQLLEEADASSSSASADSSDSNETLSASYELDDDYDSSDMSNVTVSKRPVVQVFI